MEGQDNVVEDRHCDDRRTDRYEHMCKHDRGVKAIRDCATRINGVLGHSHPLWWC